MSEQERFNQGFRRGDRTRRSQGSQQSAEVANSSPRSDARQYGASNPVTDDLRNAPGYEAGQRAADRGTGLQGNMSNSEQLDAAVDASALDVEHANEGNEVESDGFYGSAGTAGSDASDGAEPGKRPDAAPRSNRGEVGAVGRRVQPS